MKISFNKIKKYQERFMKLDHIECCDVVEIFTHKELKEIAGILGHLLYYMYMTNKEYFNI